jgi:hypothetical protein
MFGGLALLEGCSWGAGWGVIVGAGKRRPQPLLAANRSSLVSEAVWRQSPNGEPFLKARTIVDFARAQFKARIGSCRRTPTLNQSESGEVKNGPEILTVGATDSAHRRTFRAARR